MPKHKLYSVSLESPFLNSSMERIEPESPNSFLADTDFMKEENESRDQDNGDNYEICSAQNSIKSENDSDEQLHFSNFLERRPYTYAEDVEILNYVLKDQNIHKVSSVLLWKYLEAKKKNPKRTYQSLKNRFLRNIKPHIFTTYRHLIKNQDQVKRIIEKFPELKKDAFFKSTLPLEFSSKNANDKVTKERIGNGNIKEASGKTGQHSKGAPEPGSQVENDTTDPEERGVRKVIMNGKTIQVVVPRNLAAQAQSSDRHVGIYEKYLNCKSKNPLTVCPTCGRCGGPEQDLNELQDSENDVIISNSITNKKSECSQNSTNSNKILNPSEDVQVAVEAVKDSRSKRGEPPSESSTACSNSPSLLDGIKSPDRAEVEARRHDPVPQNQRSTRSRTASSTASKRKCERLPVGDLTDEELESLYQESVQKCEKLIRSEEEEALVKKCFKKNRRSIGFDSYVLLNKVNLDSFFAKSQSPSLDTLGTVTTPAEDTAKSPLVENMKRMLRSRTCNKS